MEANGALNTGPPSLAVHTYSQAVTPVSGAHNLAAYLSLNRSMRVQEDGFDTLIETNNFPVPPEAFNMERGLFDNENIAKSQLCASNPEAVQDERQMESVGDEEDLYTDGRSSNGPSGRAYRHHASNAEAYAINAAKEAAGLDFNTDADSNINAESNMKLNSNMDPNNGPHLDAASQAAVSLMQLNNRDVKTESDYCAPNGQGQATGAVEEAIHLDTKPGPKITHPTLRMMLGLDTPRLDVQRKQAAMSLTMERFMMEKPRFTFEKPCTMPSLPAPVEQSTSTAEAEKPETRRNECTEPEVSRPRYMTFEGQGKCLVDLDHLCNIPGIRQVRWIMDLDTIVVMPPEPGTLRARRCFQPKEGKLCETTTCELHAYETPSQRKYVRKFERPGEAVVGDRLSLEGEYKMHYGISQVFNNWSRYFCCHAIVPMALLNNGQQTFPNGETWSWYPMERMLPLLERPSKSLCDIMIGAGFDMAQHKTPTNVLVMPLLGTGGNLPAVKDFYNLPLHVEWMRDLNIDSKMLARAMGEALAILHWATGVTNTGVQFAIGTRDVTEEYEQFMVDDQRQALYATQLYIYSFAEVQKIVMHPGPDGPEKVCDAIGRAMAEPRMKLYLPSPVAGDYLYYRFRDAYVKMARKIINKIPMHKANFQEPELVMVSYVRHWSM
ncbi:hypothetical protein CDD82_3563 [Ophiocordyceps australis]|uniref:DUF3669 domain-containing protein n=1 Tax=Ophiocordyceps australis TaxID=1399860 RepID=A0A2C5ZC08_9HYPO|nr:hypothetical protein CDD82_3563 [Ophiocordyceps australis]